MAGYKNFAVVGAGTLGNYVIRQFLKDKAAGTVNEVVVLTRQVTTVQSIVRQMSHILMTYGMDRAPRTPSRATPK
jgi:glutamyl-tRNA reductase